MSAARPHYLLFSESRYEPAGQRSSAERDRGSGRWKFILESLDGSSKLEAADEEEISDQERLELLVVVRGLEALAQPSRVTLVTSSRYVGRGLRFGLNEWREHDWCWERFGRMSPVPHADLWQRLDRALRIHEVRCRTLRFDDPHSEPRRGAAGAVPGRQRVPANAVRTCVRRAGEWMKGWWRRSRVRAAQLL
jgi:ribonuclease HI